jgi:proteic killer suppression protein
MGTLWTLWPSPVASTSGDFANFNPVRRFEGLAGDRRGQHSLRIDDQYRVCFRWKEGNAYDVEIAKHYR